MSFLKIKGLGGAQAPATVPEGDYDVVIAREPTIEVSSKDPSVTWIQVIFNFTNAEVANPQAIFHALFLPTKKSDEAQVNQSLHRIQLFCGCFGIAFDADGFDTEGVAGLTGRISVLEKEDEYGKKNTIKKFIQP